MSEAAPSERKEGFIVLILREQDNHIVLKAHSVKGQTRASFAFTIKLCTYQRIHVHTKNMIIGAYLVFFSYAH